MTSAYQLHVQKWAGGCGNEICKRARRVYCRGSLPCDVLFVGEAPGESENVVGLPFVGPAGKLLDHIVRRALDGADLRCAFGNLVCCIPREADGAKAGEPAPEEIAACAPRLIELVTMARPRLIVCVGTLSRDTLTGPYKGKVKLPVTCPIVHITHPAAILRAPVASQGLHVQRAVITIREAVEEIA